LKTPLIKGV